MVQSRKTGSTISRLWLARETGPDHARVPVMLPRKSDSDMRRDGRNAAHMQHQPAVDERGRLRGVPDLFCFAILRALASNRVRLHAMEEKRRWRRLAKTRPQIRLRDKRPASLRGLSGWLCRGYAYGHVLARPYGVPFLRYFAHHVRMAKPWQARCSARPTRCSGICCRP